MCLSSGGRVHEGYEAVRELLEACPATALAAPVMRVPPIRWVGHRVYERVALNRTCAVPASAAPPARARVAG
jgi:predicted DCC family thiol-disulfide oxidoreductase YuxK